MRFKYKRIITLSILFFFFGLVFLNLVTFLYYPTKIDIFEGEGHVLNIKYPFEIIDNEDNEIVEISVENNPEDKKNQVKIVPLKNGKTNLEIKLLGILPIKKLAIDVFPKLKVIPGGNSIGVKLNTKGVLIVGLEEIEGPDNKKYNPGYDGGLRIGDSIIEINNIKVKNADHVIDIINYNKGKEINVKAKRNSNTINCKIKPVKSKIYKDYKIGLWVKDKTAGVGTLTFVDPKSKIYGALGHAISDAETGKILPIGKGEIMKSRVVSIKQGKRGKAGEIRGIFLETTEPLGALEKNTNYGIYGTMYKELTNPIYNKPIEIALQNEIKLGPAKILTTTDDNKIKEYDIIIEKINTQRKVSNKSMIVKIVDEELLKKTGGIVQGMSGSPIIQNGKIIGAVTHVFVNDPTKGYGIFIEWMIKKSGIQTYNNMKLGKTG
ncbi:SpoIVB peptidase [Paramaledivibacter caminithermalis]|uniref:Stage IV sporulation protein B n=1 Tax=Paramaledivibacter caminithermalis (strain DSM 15212 / CIP 107654 / DViRD3) TaxID=1121301 RepID=A0A1M6JQ08_PARC5|nr:SpoIVB peptidase [Paramaledivibacter caminithermalis]SHJ48758.1 stage IV sporulation protein B [Paramaledivibacter caminithermalis DSM 15212]